MIILFKIYYSNVSFKQNNFFDSDTINLNDKTH